MKKYLNYLLLAWLAITGCTRIEFPYHDDPPEDTGYVFFDKLFAKNGVAGDQFGIRVSMSADGNAVVIGSHYNDENGLDAGAAYIYRWNELTGLWDETKLLATNGAESDQFGRNVTIAADGSTAIIGAPYKDSRSGTAYIYRYNNYAGKWDEIRLNASNRATYSYFGYSVSLSADGNTAIIGAHGSYINGTIRTGSAYIYRCNTSTGLWTEYELIAKDRADSDWFGISVSISADSQTAISGAYGDDDKGMDSGSAYIYRWNGFTGKWDEEKLMTKDGKAGDNFGSSTALAADGNTAVVGALKNDDKGTNAGSAYIYKWNTLSGQWDEEKLLATDGADGDLFGSTVSLSADGSIVMIGAAYKDRCSGKTYIYRYNMNTGNWDETIIKAPDCAEYDYFGAGVSLSANGNMAVVGAYGDDYNGETSGSAYIYKYKK